MREGRSRAVRPSDLLVTCAVLLASALLCGAGCATEMEPRPPANQTEDGGEPGAEGGSTSTAGSAPAAGKPNGGSAGSSSAGGTGVNAFGGTASSGGKGGGASGGTAGEAPGGSGGGGSSQGGSATGGSGKGGSGSGGASPGGAGGMTQGGAGGASAGSANGGSAGGSGLGCLSGWKGSACDTCSTQTQGDKLGCVKILECYEANSCGPATCANNDDKCGVNQMGQGTAGYPIAKEVYDCACP